MWPPRLERSPASCRRCRSSEPSRRLIACRRPPCSRRARTRRATACAPRMSDSRPAAVRLDRSAGYCCPCRRATAARSCRSAVTRGRGASTEAISGNTRPSFSVTFAAMPRSGFKLAAACASCATIGSSSPPLRVDSSPGTKSMFLTTGLRPHRVGCPSARPATRRHAW